MKELILENPILANWPFHLARLTGSRQGGRNVVGLVGLLMVPLILGLLAWRFPDVVQPMLSPYIVAGIYVLVAPTLLYGSVALERERRTWELLQVTPVSNAQIIVGKYLIAVGVLVCLAATMLIPAGISTLRLQFGATMFGAQPPTLDRFTLAMLLAVAFGLVSAAIGIYISSRCSRGLTSMLGSFGVMMAWMLVYPIAVRIAFGFMGDSDAVLGLHPMVVITRVFDTNEPIAEVSMLAVGNIVTYLLLTLALLYLSIRRLSSVNDAMVRSE